MFAEAETLLTFLFSMLVNFTSKDLFPTMEVPIKATNCTYKYVLIKDKSGFK